MPPIDRVRCPRCGNEHDLSESEVGFSLPDVVHELAEPDRRARAVFTEDLCALDGKRYFVRGVLYLPVKERPEPFGWGVWAEISHAQFERCEQIWDDPQQAADPEFDGRLANHLPDYPETIGLELSARLTGQNTRPTFRLKRADHPLAYDQRHGIDLLRVLEFVSPYIHHEGGTA